MSGFDFYQQVYCLSSAANAVGSMVGTEAHLQKAEEYALTLELRSIHHPHWSLTWGPRVYKQNPDDATSGPDNVWYCAVNHEEKTLVLAMAGTAYDSLNDWIDNAEVKSMVDIIEWAKSWDLSIGVETPAVAQGVQGDDPRSLIAWGTSVFLRNVLTQVSHGAQRGTLIMDYLRDFQRNNPDYKIVFTGHSMGGAVVPAIALALVEAGYLSNSGNFKDKVWVMPSAGPTPGNESFNNTFSSNFPPSIISGYQSYNVNYYNKCDIVPQAWSTTETDDRNLNNVHKIYSGSPVVEGQINEAIIAALLIGILPESGPYRPLVGQAFKGSNVPDNLPSLKTDPCPFEHSVIEQHTTQYWSSIGILQWLQHFELIIVAQPGVQRRSPKKDQVISTTGEEGSKVKHNAVVDEKKAVKVDIKALPTV